MKANRKLNKFFFILKIDKIFFKLTSLDRNCAKKKKKFPK